MPHDHSLKHPQAPINYRKAFAIGIALNVSYVAVEAVFGLFAHSLALVADAGHNLSDVLSLLLAWGASEFGQSKPSKRFTYGLRSSSILASLANAIILLIAIGAIAWEAFQRFSQPQEVPAVTVMVVAGFGVLINAATALLFMSGRHRDLNIKGAFLHMAADAGVSLGVVLAGLAIKLTGQYWIDPAMSLVIVAVIAIGTWGLLRESIRLALLAVPEGVELERVEHYLASLPDVTAVHDLHIWPMSTTQTALTAHLEMPNGSGGDEFLHNVCQHLHDEFRIEHCTIQIEQNAKACSLAPERPV
ncbi:MAG TPA: cation diffusion facilitator family transporter [Candidatus Binatia bacterium]|nr:cation diffusion facilitator family transporter [Candidatus Binatia bacterium]